MLGCVASGVPGATRGERLLNKRFREGSAPLEVPAPGDGDPGGVTADALTRALVESIVPAASDGVGPSPRRSSRGAMAMRSA